MLCIGVAYSIDLSIIIHTKNEQKNIVACLKSCKTIASEILIIDMNSTDSTVQLAKKYGATV
ncbi:MAG: glycosyltransferase [Candidatus Pacebacteria bacterium]|nr:glycosyltransferase [Candidatus Paceibacterota bacterium]